MSLTDRVGESKLELHNESERWKRVAPDETLVRATAVYRYGSIRVASKQK